MGGVGGVYVPWEASDRSQGSSFSAFLSGSQVNVLILS